MPSVTTSVLFKILLDILSNIIIIKKYKMEKKEKV